MVLATICAMPFNIAHVDYDDAPRQDALLRQSGAFRDNQPWPRARDGQRRYRA